MNIGSLEVLLGVNTAGLSRAAVNMRRFESQVLNSNMTMQASFKALGSQMMLTGTLLTQYLTVPIALLGGIATTSFAKFETELSKIAGLTDFTSKQVKSMGNELLSFASKVNQNPVDLAKGLYFIGSSGIKDEAVAMDILKKSATAATVGLGETKVVADALTSVLNAYGQQAITAGQATDIMVMAVREGKGEADALSRVIGHVLPLASQLGVGFDEVAGSLASLTLTGKSASEASTQLARLFTTLIQAPPEAEAALEKMGISFSKIRKDLRDGGMIKMLGTLKKMIGDNTLEVLQNSKAYEQNITVLGDVFTNIRALLPVLDMLGPNSVNTVRILNSTASATGSLQKAVEAVSGTVAFRWGNAIKGMQASMIRFGAIIKEPVIALIQKLSSFVSSLAEKFAALPKATQQNIITFSVLAAVAGPLSIVFGQLVGFISAFFKLLLGTSLMSIVTQFLLLAAAVYYTYKNWDLLKTAWDNFKVSTITDKLQSMIDKFYELKPERIKKLNDEWEAYAETVKGVSEIQGQIVENQKQYDALVQQLSQVKNAQELETVYNNILRVLENINTLKAQIAAKDAQDRGIKANSYEAGALNLKLNLGHSLTRQMQNQAEKVKEVIKNTIVPKPDEIGFDDFFSKVFSDIGTDVKNGVNKLQKMITGIDLSQLGGGGGYGIDVDQPVQDMLAARQKLEKIKNDALRAIEEKPIQTGALQPIIDNYTRFTDIIKGTNAALAINAGVAAKLGPNYDQASRDVQLLNEALSELTTPEMVKTLTPEQLASVQEYLEMLQKIQNATSGNTKELGAWKNLLSSIGTLMNSLSKYMSESFQKTFNVITDIVTTIGELVNVIRNIGILIKAMAAAENAATAAKSAAIPVTLAAAAAEGVKAAASTDAAIAGAAASTAWIPIVGVGLAIAGVAALIVMLAKSKRKATGMATGGMVPSGFPNDSFPAMLTSGETVIPLNKVSEIFGNRGETKQQQVVFKIHRKELIGILEDAVLTGRSF